MYSCLLVLTDIDIAATGEGADLFAGAAGDGRTVGTQHDVNFGTLRITQTGTD
jgi:hypothetical protein